jgi:predicted small lipoprotein YifL
MHRYRQSISAIGKITAAFIIVALSACGTKGPLTPAPQTSPLNTPISATGNDLSTGQESTHKASNPT